MMKAIAGLIIVAAMASSAIAAPPHPCAAGAKKTAAALLNLHINGDMKPGDDPMTFEIRDGVTIRPPVKALKGKGKLDVLELIGDVYKANYRIRLIYAVMSDKTCALMGQEILEDANPF